MAQWKSGERIVISLTDEVYQCSKEHEPGVLRHFLKIRSRARVKKLMFTSREWVNY